MKTPIMTKLSSIASRLRTSHAIEAAVRTHGNEAAEIFNARHPGVEGPTLDYGIFFTNLGAELRSVRREMTAANDAHTAVLARIVGLRQERDELARRLADDFFVARRTLEAMAGIEKRFELLGVSGKTPRDPVGLIRQVRSAVSLLVSPKVALPDPDLGIHIDLPTMAARLESGADVLEAALAALDYERKVAERTRQVKNEAIAAYDRTSRYVARTLEGMFHLAGLHELAKRVRPASRSSGKVIDDSEEELADETSAMARVEDVVATPPSSPADPPVALS